MLFSREVQSCSARGSEPLNPKGLTPLNAEACTWSRSVDNPACTHAYLHEHRTASVDNPPSPDIVSKPGTLWVD